MRFSLKIKEILKSFFLGLHECYPRVIIIGALGRCGKGAIDLAQKAGIPRYETTNV